MVLELLPVLFYVVVDYDTCGCDECDPQVRDHVSSHILLQTICIQITVFVYEIV